MESNNFVNKSKIHNLHDFFVKSHLTEKSSNLEVSQQFICFYTYNDINKTFLKEAMKKILNLDVVKIRTMCQKGKWKGLKQKKYKKSDFKKVLIRFKQNAVEFNKRLDLILRESVNG